MERLFVYGTLMPNKIHHVILKKINGVWQKGFVLGEIKKIKLNNFAYSAIILSKSKNKKVFGYLFTSYALKFLWKKIDNFEGSNYKRKISQVFLTNNNKVEANIYCLNE